MKRTFEIEWPDDYGPAWMNRDNLLLCITSYCQHDRFAVKDVDDATSVMRQLHESPEYQNDVMVRSAVTYWRQGAPANECLFNLVRELVAGRERLLAELKDSGWRYGPTGVSYIGESESGGQT